MEKPNKEDFKYRIRTGNNLRVSYKTNWELFAKDLEEWTDKQLTIHSVGNHVFCPHCGDKRQLKVETDLNSGRVCKSVLCKGK